MAAMIRDLKALRAGLNVVRLFPSYVSSFVIMSLKNRMNPQPDSTKSKLVFIMSFPRSGTTALGSLLKQPETGFSYYGEFFAFNQWSKIIYKISNTYPTFHARFLVNFFGQKRAWKYYRFEAARLNPTRVIRSTLKNPGIHIFKIFPYHLHDETLANIITEFKPQIVFIRRNHLDRYISHMKAHESGVWHGKDSSDVVIDVNEKRLQGYIKVNERFYAENLQVARAAGCEVLDVEYERLFEPQVMRSVVRFIDWDDSIYSESIELTPRTLKQDAKQESQIRYLDALKSQGINREMSDFDFVKIENSNS
jgi:LPS sulfotransferase NodH